MTNSDIAISIIVSTLLILLLISGIALAFFIASRQRTRQQIELAQAKIAYERELRQVETEVSESMMQQFSQELHDNLGHILTCIRLELENKKIDDPKLETTLAPMERYMDEASQQLRLLSRSLNTDYINHVGLRSAINLEVERQQQLRKFKIVCEQQYEDEVLDKNQELMVFRIFQEVIQNAIRHSVARNVYINIQSAPDFKLTIKDDGKGFVLDDITKSNRASGLKNMIKRAHMADMVCKIDSSTGAGTIVTLYKKQSVATSANQ
jgi:two-component system, NarL family, sensor kinase